MKRYKYLLKESLFNSTNDFLDYLHNIKRNKTVRVKKVTSIKGSIKKYDGIEGKRNHCTCVIKANLSIDLLINYKGYMGEKREVNKKGNDIYFGNYKDENFIKFLTNIADEGIKENVQVVVYPNEPPKIFEGNHRVSALYYLGITFCPVTISFYGKAEDSTKDKNIKELIDALIKKYGVE